LDQKNAASGVAFSPDGRTLAALDNADVSLWNVATRQQATTLDQDNAGSVAFSPDGRTLAVGGTSGAGLWDVITGRKIATLDGSSQVDNVAYSPSSPVLTTGDSLRNVDF
jgi:WD40 repeat protein